jgi:hypothetical protein
MDGKYTIVASIFWKIVIKEDTMAHSRNSKGGSDHAANPAKNKVTPSRKPKRPGSPEGDTGRSSNQGRKLASGGSKDTNNRGHRKGS